MKKAIVLICGVLLFLITVGFFLNNVQNTYDDKIGSNYYDKIGDLYNNDTKNQGLRLQENSLARKDNILIFGSSELGSLVEPFHPSYFFESKKNGFQINLIGRGYTQSIIHSVNFGALGSKIKGKKVVFIISPQWFSKKGLESSYFGPSFSKYQFYEFMFNKDIDKDIKINIAKRVGSLAGEAGELPDIKTFCDLYAADNIICNTALKFLLPYYKFDNYLLSINDLVKTEKVLDSFAGGVENLTASSTVFNWEEERKKAVETGKKGTDNNDFLIENGYYDMYIKSNIGNLENSYKNISFRVSPEYDDLKLFLDMCKSLDVKPLVVSVPVNGKWYDYCGFDKKDRDDYYKRINKMVASYGFEIADFSGYEYEDYFLKDIMHLGWKGWVYVDEAIDKYYHEGK